MSAAWFGARLKELRERAGLTQSSLAEKAGLSQRAVSHWEQGLREPGWSAVLALSDALGVPLEEFRKQPADTEPVGRGRPAKTSGEKPETAARKKGKRE
jgi:transcriptional regulator with XRE-family HTH domain